MARDVRFAIDTGRRARPPAHAGRRACASSARRAVRVCGAASARHRLAGSARTGRGDRRPRINLLGTDAQGRDVLAPLILATPQTLKIGIFAGLIGPCRRRAPRPGRRLLRRRGGCGDPNGRRRCDDHPRHCGPGACRHQCAHDERGPDGGDRRRLSWMYPTRTMRAQTLSMRERPYIDVARLNGIGGLRLVLSEVLPNLLPYIAASFVTAVSSAMLATIGLEALGLGPQNELTLGMMIYWAQFYGAILRGMWWWWTPPGVDACSSSSGC